MAYFELNPNGATGVANSSPITLANNHSYPLPIGVVTSGNISASLVSGSTGMTSSGVTYTVIPASTGKYVYVTSIVVINASSTASIQTVFKNGVVDHIAACSTPGNGLSTLNFPTPLKLNLNVALTATINISPTSPSIVTVNAVGFVASI